MAFRTTPPGQRPAQATRPKYVYRPPSPESIRERAQRQSNRYDQIYGPQVEVFTPKEKSNLIRILPPTWDNYDHHAYSVFSHRDVGPEGGTYLCLWKMKGEFCPICAASRQAKDDGDEETRKKYQYSERLLAWIIDRDADDWQTPRLWNMSWTQDRDLTAVTHNERTGKPLYIVDPDHGFDVTFQRAGTGLNTRYYGYVADREPSPIAADPDVQDAIMERIVDEPIPSILVFQTAEYLQKALDGVVGSAPAAAPPAPEPQRPSARPRAAPLPPPSYEPGVSYQSDDLDADDAAAVAGNGGDPAPWEDEPVEFDEAGEPVEAEEEPVAPPPRVTSGRQPAASAAPPRPAPPPPRPRAAAPPPRTPAPPGRPVMPPPRPPRR